MERAESFLQEIAERFIPKNPTQSGTFRVLMVAHGGFIGEFFNVVRKYQGKPPIYNNSAKNCAIFCVRFQRNAKGGLTPTVVLENDNSHLQIAFPAEGSSEPEEETKQAVSKGKPKAP